MMFRIGGSWGDCADSIVLPCETELPQSELPAQPRDERSETAVPAAGVVGEEGIEVLVLWDRDELELLGGDVVAVPGVAPDRLPAASPQPANYRAIPLRV